MKRVLVLACLTLLTLGVLATDARAQRLQDRIDAVREQRREAARQAEPQPEVSLQIPRKMSTIIDEVFLDQATATDAFNWWSTTTDIPLIIDWNAMEQEGIDPEQPITLDLKTVPARLLLDVLMRQASPDIDLIYEATPWYVQVMTKRQANRHPVLRVYDVADMVMQIPNFTNAPSFDLSQALSNTNSGGGSGGGGGGGGSSGLFSDNNDNEASDQPTKNESGQSLADTIRETIEPDIWQANGGLFSSVRYYNGRLIVNAPMYVHRQIGIPVVSANTSRDRLGQTPPANNAVGGKATKDPGEPFGKQKR